MPTLPAGDDDDAAADDDVTPPRWSRRWPRPWRRRAVMSASVWQEKSSAKARSLRCITAKLARCQFCSSRNSCSIAVMYCAESADNCRRRRRRCCHS